MPRLVHAKALARRDDFILDFGAGKDAFGTKYLRDLGYTHVTAYEIGNNFVEGVHNANALHNKYSVVFANNVLNVQPSVTELLYLIETIRDLVAPGGNFVCNFPLNPHGRMI
jgi:hypothetical protein